MDHLKPNDSVEKLDLSVRALNVLLMQTPKVDTVGQLVVMSSRDIRIRRGAGKKVVEQIRAALAVYGLQLWPDEPYPGGAHDGNVPLVVPVTLGELVKRVESIEQRIQPACVSCGHAIHGGFQCGWAVGAGTGTTRCACRSPS